MARARAQDLLADSNPMVVANAVAALAEVHEVGGAAAFHITSTSLFKLLRALNECTEWGQVPASGRPAGRAEAPAPVGMPCTGATEGSALLRVAHAAHRPPRRGL